MRAFALVEPRPMAARLIDLPEPALGPNDVLIKIEAAAICGTDQKVLHWAPGMAARVGSTLPRILGHEAAGIVHSVGSAVKQFAPGDRVVPIVAHYCRQCRFCLEGRSSICDNRPTLGIEIDGVFADYRAVPADRVYPIEQGVDMEVASLLDALATGIQACEQVPIGPDDVVAIVGAGTIGLIVALVAQAYKPKRLFITGLEADRDRLRLARSLGIDAVEAQDPAAARKAVGAVTGGYGADVVFDASGHSSGILAAIDLVRKGGTVGLVGLPFGATEIHTSYLVWGEKTLVGIRSCDQQVFDKALKYTNEGTVDLSPLITHRLPLTEAMQGFDLMERKQAIRVILQP